MSHLEFHLIDSTLRDMRGHHLEYDKSVCGEFLSRGYRTFVYCHRDAKREITDCFQASRIFSRDIHDLYNPLPFLSTATQIVMLAINNLAYRRDLEKINARTLTPSSLLFVHTISPFQLFGLLSWYSRIPVRPLPVLIILFRYSLGETARVNRANQLLYRTFFRRARSLSGGRLVYASDSDILAKEYSGIAKRDFLVLPIPHIPGPTTGKLDKAGKIRVAYFGDARLEKGYHLLPDAIRSIGATRRNVHFIVQSNVSGDPPPEIQAAREKIRSCPNTTIIDHPLDSAGYYTLLSQCDAVLLPYSPVTYRDRTSGIFAEALASGKPVITSGNTWMAWQIERFGGCGIVMDGFEGIALTRALERFLDNEETYLARAGEASRQWRCFHNPKTFVDLLLGAVSNPCWSPPAER